MHSRSKTNINNQFNKLTSIEAIRAMAKSLQLKDQELTDKIFWELPKNRRPEVLHYFHLYQQKLSNMQALALLKASIAVHFYQTLLNY